MRIHLTNAGTVALREPADFKRLDVLVDAQPQAQLEQAIARIGRREDDTHVRLAPSVLRFLSGHAGEPAWEAGFAAMLGYAAKHGWVDDNGEVRAHLSANDSDEVVSIDDFKAAMRALPAGISAISTGSGEQRAGMIVSSLTSISAEPPLVGFFAHRTSSVREPLLATGRFVANILGEDHGAIISSFLSAPQGPARFKAGQWVENAHGLPVLADAIASIECDIVCTQTLGTHDLIVGKIRKTACCPASPVVNFNASTHRIVRAALVQ